LQPRNRLAESGTTCFPIVGLEVGQFHPSDERFGIHPDRFGRCFNVALRQERGDRLFFLSPVFCAVAGHLVAPNGI
jgi:hypothetical protein